jgi:hypothetical protein
LVTKSRVVLDVNELGRTRAFEDAEFLFQQTACIQLETLLNRILERLRIFDTGTERDFESVSQRHLHQNIFIDGERGTGKTTFLVNIGKVIKRSDELTKDLVCLAPLDPTQSQDRLSFLWDVLARTSNFLEERRIVRGTYSQDSVSPALQKALAELNDAVEAYQEQQSLPAHERNVIALRQYEIALEQSVDAFFEAVCNTLRCKAIVLPIDDIDLADNKTFAFNVLDVVRLYLSSPRLIPVVAGDFKNYQVLLENKFYEVYERPTRWDEKAAQGNSKKRRSSAEIQHEAGHLSDAYLDKIFPTPHRIRLISISEILNTSGVVLSFAPNQGDKRERTVLWNDFVSWFLEAQYKPWLWAVPDKSQMNAEFNSVRSFLAYVNTFQDVIRHYSTQGNGKREELAHPSEGMGFVLPHGSTAQGEYLKAIAKAQGFGRICDVVISMGLGDSELPPRGISNSALVLAADIRGFDEDKKKEKDRGAYSCSRVFSELEEALKQI